MIIQSSGVESILSRQDKTFFAPDAALGIGALNYPVQHKHILPFRPAAWKALQEHKVSSALQSPDELILLRGSPRLCCFQLLLVRCLTWIMFLIS